jgi:hypothetical protein
MEKRTAIKNHQRRKVDVAGSICRLLAAGRDRGDQGPENGNGGRRERQLAGSRRLSHRLSVFGQLGGISRPRPGFEGRSMSFTRRRARSLPIAKVDDSRMAPC